MKPEARNPNTIGPRFGCFLAAEERSSQRGTGGWRGKDCVGFVTPLTARGHDMGNKVGIDMGNSFHFNSRPFVGHVMDDPFSSGAAIAVRKNGLEGPTRHVAVVSNISNQPQVRLQMEATLRRGREAGAAGSVPLSWAIAWSDESDLVEANSEDAAAASKLGQSEAASSTGPGTPQATRSVGAHDWSMAQEDETEWPSPATFPPRAVDEFGEVERGESQQPGMDRRFQRVVSNARRAAGGTVDSAGPV